MSYCLDCGDPLHADCCAHCGQCLACQRAKTLRCKCFSTNQLLPHYVECRRCGGSLATSSAAEAAQWVLDHAAFHGESHLADFAGGTTDA